MDLHTDWVVLSAECGGQSAEWSVQWVQECMSTGVLSAGCRAQEWCCVLLAGDRAKRPDDVDTYIRVEKSAKWAGGQVAGGQVGRRPSGPEVKGVRGQVGQRPSGPET